MSEARAELDTQIKLAVYGHFEEARDLYLMVDVPEGVAECSARLHRLRLR